MQTKKYPCTQRELFAVCASGWASCNQNLEKFTSFRPLYSTAYVEARLKEIAEVSAMPDKAKRSSRQDLARTALKNKLAECHKAWKKLKLSVASIWPEEQLKAHFKNMGQEFYSDSVNFKWEACTGLMDSALGFVEEHAEVLKASPVAGPGIIEEFRTLTADLHTLLSAYVGRMKDEPKGADVKQEGCNKLYKDLLLMFADARLIFKPGDVIMEHFYFDAQLILVSGQSGAGIKGTISNGKLPVSEIKDLLLVLAENGDEAYISEDGTYRFSQLGGGTYTIQVSATGYQSQTIPSIVVNTGAYATRHITLVPEVPTGGDMVKA